MQMNWMKRLAWRGPQAAAATPAAATAGRFDASNARHMAWLTFAYLAFHLLLWTVLASVSHRAPPLDNIEQLVWQQSLEWGYYKHPPFPTWWVHGWTLLLGRSMWVTFFSAQLSVVMMLFFIWRIALLVTSPARAFTSVVLSSLLIYHGVHGIMANHNTLQLMPVGLLLWLSLLAVRGGQLWRWGLVGVAAALCLLSKYSAVIWLAALGLWWLQDRRMWNWRAVAGVLLALAVCLLLLEPHLHWLTQADSPGLAYAARAVQGQNDSDNLGHWGRLGKFAVAQVARVLPLLLGLGWLLALLWRAERAAASLAKASDLPAPSPPPLPMPMPMGEWRFILFVSCGPLLLTALVGALGVRLGSAWAATFFVTAGLLALHWVPTVPARQLVRSALWVGIGLELLLASGMALGSGWLADLTGHASRSNFPAARLARQLDRVWHQHADTPLRIVVGETWLAGNMSVRSRGQPLVFIDADPQKAPWIKPNMVNDCGALILIDREDPNAVVEPRVAELLAQASASGMLNLPWTPRPGGPRLKLQWAVLPAQNSAACPP
jgi:hypothetical protein